MCGIAFCMSATEGPDRIAERLAAIERVQLHRGPNGQGALTFEVGRSTVGIGQQRLSIIDLTSAGQQPMVSPCGRYLLSYNGELYNYRELAEELGDDPLLEISTGDTAVMLAALVRWGVSALSRFNGMWAFVFVDKREGTALVARDRLGVKPLYFSQNRGTLVMASEVKGVLAGSMGRKFNINRDVVSRFLLQSLTSATHETFFRDIEAFPAASYAQIQLTSEEPLSPQKYWHHPFEIGSSLRKVSRDEIKELLFDSVRLRLRSDVSVGITLSGGLDSSSILAASRAVSPEANLKVLSVVSRDRNTNEEPFIDLMAAHAGCDVIKIQTDDDPEELWSDLDDAVWHYDHPVSSFSNLAHRKIIRKARENDIVVLLTGQGADEQLGGYNKFFYFYMMDSIRRGSVFKPGAMALNSLLKGTIISEFRISHAKRYVPFLRDGHAAKWMGEGLSSEHLLSTGLGESYREREWRDMVQLSLPDLLDSEDRASMAFSTEMRTPFLDYRLVETLARTPVEQKLTGGWTKHVLRSAMQDILPREITWRKDKKGYSVPGKSWLTGPLRKEVEHALDKSMMSEQLGFVDRKGVTSLYQDLLADRTGVRYEDILSVISLERWVSKFEPYIDGVQ